LPRLHPLLPWLLAALLFALLTGGFRERIVGDAAREVRDPTFGTLERLPVRRDAGEALLLLGNSRVGFAIPQERQVQQVADIAGMVNATAKLVFGPELSASTLRAGAWRLAAFRPTVVVMQIDLMLPLPPKAQGFDLLRRLENYQRSGPDLDAGLAILSQLWESRRVVLELPIGERLDATLSRAWHADRASLHAMLRARGVEVISEQSPWPDRYFDDGVHFSAEGAVRLRRWLGERLGQR